MIAGLLLGFAVAALGAGVYRRFAPLDVPNERSSHERPIPRGGGVAIVAGFLVGLLVWLAQGGSLSPRALGWLAGALLVGAVSFIDDLSPAIVSMNVAQKISSPRRR